MADMLRTVQLMPPPSNRKAWSPWTGVRTTAAEFYYPSLEHALSKRNPVLIHRLDLDQNLKNSVNSEFRHLNIDQTRLNYRTIRKWEGHNERRARSERV